MFQLPTQLSSIVLVLGNVRDLIHLNRDNDDIDTEISNDDCEDPGEPTWSSEIKDDDLDIWQEVLYLDQARRDKTL